MKILDRYIFRETLTPALIALMALTFIFCSQQLGSLLEIIVRQSATLREIGAVSIAIIPNVFIFTIPMAVLVGILTGFGRMSSDSEAIALRAAGVSMRRLFVPIMLLACLGWIITLTMTLWLAPRAAVRSRELRDSLGLKQFSLLLKPRVFNEELTDCVLYVQDIAANGLEWRGIMLVDNRNPDNPQVTFARSGRLVADRENRTFQLTLEDGSTHVVSPLTPSRDTSSGFQSNVFLLPMPNAPPPKKAAAAEASTVELWKAISNGTATYEERVQFHRRLALPFACLAFGLIGLPLGVSTTRGSKSMGLVLSLILMLVYYLVFAGGTQIAANAQLPPFLSAWFGNVLFSIIGAMLLFRSDYENENQFLTLLASITEGVSSQFEHLRQTRKRIGQWAYTATHHPKFFRVLDIYILRGFWFFFSLVLVVFVSLFIIITLFELLPEIVKNNVGGAVVVNYFLFLLPQILYWVVPLTVLLAILINLGTLTKTNEILAVKAGAVSLYRMALPLLLMGMFLSFSIYLLQDFILPATNQRQDEYLNVIKGRAPQTYRDPQRKWMVGSGDRIYHYNYFDQDQNMMGGLSIFEFKPDTFDLTQWLFADRAESKGNGWTLENGWVRRIPTDHQQTYEAFDSMSFSGMDSPEYFKREVRTAAQMTYRELDRYVGDLRRRGFDVSSLTVDLYRKLSFPMVSFIMAIIGVPFSFKTGRRGAFYGIGLCIGVGIFYWSTFELFDKLGGINQLSPMIAAWFPNLIFGFGGAWLMLRVKT